LVRGHIRRCGLLGLQGGHLLLLLSGPGFTHTLSSRTYKHILIGPF
jgi:hypothetical protein